MSMIPVSRGNVNSKSNIINLLSAIKPIPSSSSNMDKKLWFRNICTKNHFDISDAQIALIDKFVSLLLEWNKKINLISRRHESNIWSRHILSSVSFLFRFQLYPQSSILDIGTGGGLPGIPLAIIQPNLRVSLIDSIQKKIRALNDMLFHLQLDNVDTLCGRAEDLSEEIKYKHSFDYVIARGVAPIKDIVRWSKQVLKSSGEDEGTLERSHRERTTIPRGAILLLKGGDLTKEIGETKIKLKPQIIQAHQIIIRDAERTDLADKKLVIVQP